jgi:hypothetical protein
MKNTNEIFQRLSRGQFISNNSIDMDTRALYNDIEENFEEYAAYFKQIDFLLCSGNGYYYFSRLENKVVIENKLRGLQPWIDYLDFFHTFDTSFGPGTQFSLAQIEVRMDTDLELKQKLKDIFNDNRTIREKLEALATFLTNMGFAEKVSDTEDVYQVTMAYNYIEQLLTTLTINDKTENAIPE